MITIISTNFSAGSPFDCMESQTSSVEGSCVVQSFPWNMVCGPVVQSLIFVMGCQTVSRHFPSSGLNSSHLHIIQALWAPQGQLKSHCCIFGGPPQTKLDPVKPDQSQLCSEKRLFCYNLPFLSSLTVLKLIVFFYQYFSILLLFSFMLCVKFFKLRSFAQTCLL